MSTLVDIVVTLFKEFFSWLVIDFFNFENSSKKKRSTLTVILQLCGLLLIFILSWYLILNTH
ncbi:MAG: hypothetical protein ACI9E5_000746 [Candidatus Omnitrophota bacterium]|jgi:hypothetical protein